MKRLLVIAVLCLAVPCLALADKPAEPHPDNDVGFVLGVWCAPFVESPSEPPLFDNTQGNRLAVDFAPGVNDLEDDYAAFFCDSDGSGTFTSGDALLCCKRHNGRSFDHVSQSANCHAFQVVEVVPVDADGDGVTDFFSILINPNGPPNACAGIKQSSWTRGFGNASDG